jgi:hypothetical protein
MSEDYMVEFEGDDAEEPSLDGCDRIPLDSDTDEDNDMVSTIKNKIWVTLFLSPSPPRVQSPNICYFYPVSVSTQIWPTCCPKDLILPCSRRASLRDLAYASMDLFNCSDCRLGL